MGLVFACEDKHIFIFLFEYYIITQFLYSMVTCLVDNSFQLLNTPNDTDLFRRGIAIECSESVSSFMFPTILTFSLVPIWWGIVIHPPLVILGEFACHPGIEKVWLCLLIFDKHLRHGWGVENIYKLRHSTVILVFTLHVKFENYCIYWMHPNNNVLVWWIK